MSDPSGCLLLSCAVATRAAAREISLALVSGGLAPAAHVTSSDTVRRRGAGVVQERRFVVSAETSAGLLPEVRALVVRLHALEAGGLSAVAGVRGSDEFLAWMAAREAA